MRLSHLMLAIAFMLSLIAPAYGQDGDVRRRARLYEPVIAEAARKYGVDPHLLWTIGYLESGFRSGLVSPKGARGLMQFMDGTAVRYGLMDPYNPKESIAAAARHIRDLQERFGARGDLILAAYNAGEGAVEAFRDGKRLVTRDGRVINPDGIRTGGIPPYQETRGYVARGRIIYQDLIREGVFPIRQQRVFEDKVDKASVTRPGMQEPLSVYASEPGQGTEDINTIYAN